MKNDKTIIKINATKSQANQWKKRAKSLGIPRADYLSSLLASKETFSSGIRKTA
jgi:hypothetical protein